GQRPASHETASCNVGFCGESTIRGKKKSFHVIVNVRSPSTAATGLTAGRITCQKIRHVLQPSTRAESTSSFGTDWTMYWRIRKTPNAVTRLGAITAFSWLTQWKWIISMYSGITPSCTGTIIVITITISRAELPRKLSLANANPASALKKTTAIVTELATMNEFTSADQKSTFTSPELNSRPM